MDTLNEVKEAKEIVEKMGDRDLLLRLQRILTAVHAIHDIAASKDGSTHEILEILENGFDLTC